MGQQRLRYQNAIETLLFELKLTHIGADSKRALDRVAVTGGAISSQLDNSALLNLFVTVDSRDLVPSFICNASESFGTSSMLEV